MKLTDLDLKRSRGLASGIALEHLGSGFNVIVGSNGSGKSSLCRAISGLLWDTDDFKGAAQGTWEVAGKRLNVMRESGTGPRWADGAKLALPQGRFRGCFSFSVDDFLIDKETDAEIQQVIRTELLAGFDLSKVLRDRPRALPSSSPVSKLKGELIKAARRAQMLHGEHRALADEKRRHKEKVGELEECKQARDRSGVLQQALELANKRVEWTEAEERLSDFPEGLELLRGDEDKLWATRLRDERDREENLRKLHAREAKARAALQATELSAPVLKSELDLLRGREEKLRQLETQLSEIGEREAKAVAVLQEARKGLRALPQSGDGGVDRFAQLEGLLERIVALEARRTNLTERIEDGAENPGGVSLEAPFAQGIAALAGWLQADSGASQVRWLPQALGGLGCVLFALGIATDWGTGLAMLAGALLVGLALWLRFTRKGDDRERYARDFSSLPLDKPLAWETGALVDRMVELQSDLAEQEALRYAAEAAQKSKRRLQQVEQQHQALLEELRPLQGALGAGLDGSRLDLMQVAHLIRKQSEAAFSHAEALAQKEEASARLGRELSAANDTLGNFLIDAVKDAEGVRAAKDSLERREADRARASAELETLGQDIDGAQAALEHSRRAKQEFLVSLGLDDGDQRKLTERLGRLDEWNIASTACAALANEVARLERNLAEHPDLLTLDVMTARRRMGDNADIASELDRWNDEVAQLSVRIEKAQAGHELADAMAQEERQRDALAEMRDRLLESAAADFLIAGVARDHQDLAQPDILEHATQLFAQFTRHRYKLVSATYSEGSLPFEIQETDGETKRLSELSSGTRSQLGLALRFAVAQSVEVGDPLPLVLDEALTNSDPERFRDVVRSLHQLVLDGRQIFFFTADPLDARRLEDVLKELDAEPARCFDLDRLRGETRAAESLVTDPIPPVPKPEPGELPEQYAKRLDVPAVDLFAGVDALHLYYLCSDDLDGLYAVLCERVETVGKTGHLLDSEKGLWTPEQRARFEARRGIAAAWLEHYQVGRAPKLHPEVLREGPLGKGNYIEPLVQINAELGGDAMALMAVLDVKSKDRDKRLSRFQGIKREELRQDLLGRGLLTLDGVLDPEERLVRCLGAAQTYLGRGETTREEVVQLANAFEQWVGQEK